MIGFKRTCWTGLRSGIRGGLALCAVLLSSCVSEGSVDATLQRGDELFARGQMDEALAEYRLAIRQGGSSGEVFARVGHTYSAMGRIEETRDYYARAIEETPSYRDQAVADLVGLALDAHRDNDRFGIASAVQAAQSILPGVTVSELALPLAQHYASNGEYSRSLPFFQEAISTSSGAENPEVLFEFAEAQQEAGDCERALLFFQRYRDVEPRARRSEVDWHTGDCSFQLALDRRADGRLEDALLHLQTLTEVGEPRNLLPRGYFAMGEIFAEMGECDAALAAFGSVVELGPTSPNALVERASRRIDDIRFPRTPRTFRTGVNQCG